MYVKFRKIYSKTQEYFIIAQRKNNFVNAKIFISDKINLI